MQVGVDNGLESLGLKLKIVIGKINVQVYSKTTNSFTHVLPPTYQPYKSNRNVPKDITLRSQCTCDSDEKYNQDPIECQNYFLDCVAVK